MGGGEQGSDRGGDGPDSTMDDVVRVHRDPSASPHAETAMSQRPEQQTAPGRAAPPIVGGAAADLAEDDGDLAGTVIAERYRLEGKLGSGGMGDVYVAEHLALSTKVAVKVLHPHIAIVDEYARRFRREARAASLLQHRNVVSVLDFGSDGDRLYLVMEMLQGETLADWLYRRDEPPPLDDVGDIMKQLFDAFDAAHCVNIVHRDLKPENVFLSEQVDGVRIVKVVDFGLAHVEDPTDEGSTLTNADAVAGTPHFMSPEQCRSLAVGPSADLYALGCVLTSLLQIDPPFAGSTHMEVMTKQMFWPPPPLARAEDNERVPPLLERLRLDLLAKKPVGRPATAAEAKARLEEALSAAATAQRLPPRKGDAPPGARADRLPAWTRASEPPPAVAAASEGTHSVGLLRLGDSADGVAGHCQVGLAAHGMPPQLVDDDSSSSPRDYDALVLDAGSELDLALRRMKARSAADAPPVVVCVEGLTTDGINELIAAGAGDVLTYPVQVDALVRKVRRLLRRKRRRR